MLFFEKPSLRTRLTFEAGINSLGGSSFFVDQTHSRLGQREPLNDVAHNVERWVDGLVLRTFSHSTVADMAAFASIPVINALSDHEHPCQAFADYFTLQEKFGDLTQVKLAYVGDGNNVAHSLLLAAATLGSHMAVATPAGYEPDAQVLAKAREIATAHRRHAGNYSRSAIGGCRRQGRLYGRVGEHGTGSGDGVAAEDFLALPGQSQADVLGRARCGFHALPAGSSRR